MLVYKAAKRNKKIISFRQFCPTPISGCSTMRTVIIGSGNVATVLGRMAVKAGHPILQVFSRHMHHAGPLANELGSQAISRWEDISQEADLYVVAIPDSALPQLHQFWKARSGMVVHTAGAVSLNALAEVSKNYGVLYPLQSLRKEKSGYGSFPLLTDANSPENLTLITHFAQSLGGQASHVNDAGRAHLHVGAVVVNNLANYLYTLAAEYCEATGSDFGLLKPLIHETTQRLNGFHPAAVQTGPAARGDMATIGKHLQMLEGFPELRKVYHQLTDSIVASGRWATADGKT